MEVVPKDLKNSPFFNSKYKEQVKSYFTEQEWNKLTDYDQIQCIFLYESYIAMNEYGAPVEKPSFVLAYEAKNKNAPPSSVNEVSSPTINDRSPVQIHQQSPPQRAQQPDMRPNPSQQPPPKQFQQSLSQQFQQQPPSQQFQQTGMSPPQQAQQPDMPPNHRQQPPSQQFQQPPAQQFQQTGMPFPQQVSEPEIPPNPRQQPASQQFQQPPAQQFRQTRMPPQKQFQNPGMPQQPMQMSHQIVELNVGGVGYAATMTTLTSDANCILKTLITNNQKDSKGRIFIDRDGVLFRYVLDYLRDKKITLPENFQEKFRLLAEFDFFKLEDAKRDLNESLDQEMRDVSQSNQSPGRGYITIGYRGSFAFGSAGMADVKFRKLSRLLVCGRVTLCREVFGETLNESRDPDHGESERYTSRFFLKHSSLEQAFDCLQEGGFKCVASCGSGTSGAMNEPLKPGVDAEENKWNHYNEFVFVRE